MDKLWKGIFYCELFQLDSLYAIDATLRLLDVGQTLGAAGPRYRAGWDPSDHHIDTSFFGISARVLGDNSPGVEWDRQIEVSICANRRFTSL